jgi:hypothetical protein
LRSRRKLGNRAPAGRSFGAGLGLGDRLKICCDWTSDRYAGPKTRNYGQSIIISCRRRSRNSFSACPICEPVSFTEPTFTEPFLSREGMWKHINLDWMIAIFGIFVQCGEFRELNAQSADGQKVGFRYGVRAGIMR